MPELPEVETVRRGLEPAMRRRPDRERSNCGGRTSAFPSRPASRERLNGTADRRAHAPGQISSVPAGQRRNADRPSRHVGLVPGRGRRDHRRRALSITSARRTRSTTMSFSHLDNGKIVTYNDPRRFGFMDLVATEALAAIRGSAASATSRLAPKFDAARLAKLFSGSRAPLKAALLDQKRIAGLGNIYVCEALFRARLSPSRPAGILARRARRPDPRRRSAGASDPRRARGSDRGGRLDLARPSPGGRRTRLFPACLRGLRPRRLALPAAALRRDDRPARPSPAARPSTARSAKSSGVPRAGPSRRPSSLTRAGAAPISRGNPVQRRENGRLALFRAFCCRRRSSARPDAP